MEDKRRKAERFDFPKTIDYSADGPTTAKVLKGVAINISQKGLCIFAFVPHVEGQQIVIKSPLPVDHRVATVRWIREEGEGMFRVGLGFNDGLPETGRKKTDA